MIDDPIVEELRIYRKEHAAQYNNDIDLIVKALKEYECESGYVYLNPGPKLLSQKASVETLNFS